MPDILLSTLNARYAHASFGLRYLLANLGNLQTRASIAEFDIAQKPLDILESILSQNPKILALGVYIWNVQQTTELLKLLQQLRPDITVILGGPEVSHETNQQEITQLADHIITGEADLAFPELCRHLLSSPEPDTRNPTPVLTTQSSIIPAPLPNFDQMQLPYHLYNAKDIDHRVVYVEASRGCPFKCEFCLSSLDVPLRNVPLDRFLPAMQDLLDRGLRQFKFVDRTFNLNINISRSILQFFLERYTPGLFLHFEMIPDHLPDPLCELIRQFPPGSLQFEIGVQTFNQEVAARISRKQDNAKVEKNFRFLRDHTGVHIHADLIAGLPGESLESFAAGFDRLVALRPHEIQLGILKRLRGAPIARHTDAFAMVYSPQAPYEILQNNLIDFPTMQRIRRMARYWDLLANSGNFSQSAPLIWQNQEQSPFYCFLNFSDWLYARNKQTHGIALSKLTELLWNYLTQELKLDTPSTAQLLWQDYQRAGRSDRPAFLRPWISDSPIPRRQTSHAPRRQARHLS